MRKHGRHCGDGARAAAVSELAIHLVGQRALFQHDDDPFPGIWQRRHRNIHQPIGYGLREPKIDAISADRGAAGFDLFNEIEQRRPGCEKLAQPLLP